VSLTGLGSCYWRSGAFIAADRCLDLQEALAAALGEEPDSLTVLDRATQAIERGQIERGRQLLDQAETLDAGANSGWLEDSIQCERLYLALVADRSLTMTQLSYAAPAVQSMEYRREITALRYRLGTREGEFDQALAASEEHDQLGRNAGLDIAPAMTAFLLAKLGRVSEAAAAVEEALTKLPRIHPAKRPHRDLAWALRELGRNAEAASHAHLAYRQAWAEGPPNGRYWELRDADELLHAMGEPVPDLPTVDPASVKIPLEDEIRAYIARLRAER
jgi:tetratricopeptide (TPR) repeat protein